MPQAGKAEADPKEVDQGVADFDCITSGPVGNLYNFGKPNLRGSAFLCPYSRFFKKDTNL